MAFGIVGLVSLSETLSLANVFFSEFIPSVKEIDVSKDFLFYILYHAKITLHWNGMNLQVSNSKIDNH